MCLYHIVTYTLFYYTSANVSLTCIAGLFKSGMVTEATMLCTNMIMDNLIVKQQGGDNVAAVPTKANVHNYLTEMAEVLEYVNNNVRTSSTSRVVCFHPTDIACRQRRALGR